SQVYWPERTTKMTEKPEEFLNLLRPNGPWVLVAINPDTPNIETITVTDTADFVRRYNGVSNIYYSMNPTRGPMDIKPKKEHIAAVEFICADLDPKKDETAEDAKARYLEALRAFRPLPTAIVDSGNGIQALWRLREPVLLNGDGEENKKKI